MTTARTASTRHSFRRTLSTFAEVMGGARACASAIESGRAPSRQALQALGIDPDTWNNIGKL